MHCSHAERSALDCVPLLHGEHAAPLALYVPGAQASQAVLSAFVSLPLAHVAHVPSVVPMAFAPYSAVQFLHSGAPTTVPKPAWHLVQVNEPFLPWVLRPFGHIAHSVAGFASASERPTAHTAQAVAPAGAYLGTRSYEIRCQETHVLLHFCT